jgi:hypothetical protein
MFVKGIIALVFLGLLVLPVSAVLFEETAGPWKVAFDLNQTLNSRNEFKEADQSGYSVWVMTLVDEKGHEIGWLSFRSFPNLQKASKDAMDGFLNIAIEGLQVTSPVKTNYLMANESARMGEGYSSISNRNWRGVTWPYKPEYDDFTGTNMTRHFVTFSSLFEEEDFDAIIKSLSLGSRLK